MIETQARNYEVIQDDNKVPIKAWIKGVPIEYEARRQVINTAKMPFVFRHIALMPDCHFGMGATIGSVVPTKAAIIPAAVGVDIGCGMCAVRISLKGDQLPDDLKALRNQIERDVPVGMDSFKDKNLPKESENAYRSLSEDYLRIIDKHPKIESKHNPLYQLGTLGGGNHFIEICLDENNEVWIMLHSGSRGIGNKIGHYFINLAKEEMKTHFINLPDKDLAYLSEGTKHFNDYWFALGWAQRYASVNRFTMMNLVFGALRRHLPDFKQFGVATNCHHNYTAIENHFGENVYVTRKGAVRAREGDMGIIPGSMGARSFIVRGKGNPESFNSCSHGAGRTMSRTAAKARFSVADHTQATMGVECRKDAGVLDETPMAYKDIDSVMAAQYDLVDIVHTLKQVLCVKG